MMGIMGTNWPSSSSDIPIFCSEIMHIDQTWFYNIIHGYMIWLGSSLHGRVRLPAGNRKTHERWHLLKKEIIFHWVDFLIFSLSCKISRQGNQPGEWKLPPLKPGNCELVILQSIWKSPCIVYESWSMSLYLSIYQSSYQSDYFSICIFTSCTLYTYIPFYSTPLHSIPFHTDMQTYLCGCMGIAWTSGHEAPLQLSLRQPRSQ